MTPVIHGRVGAEAPRREPPMRSHMNAAMAVLSCAVILTMLPSHAAADPSDSPSPSPGSTATVPPSPSASPNDETQPSATQPAPAPPPERAPREANAPAPGVTVVSGQDFTGIVGKPMAVRGSTTVTAPTRASTEVNVGHWSTSQVTTLFSGGDFELRLTYGWDVPGTYEFRLRVDTASGSSYSDPFTVRRLGTAPTITSAPSTVFTNTPGTAQVSVANTGAGQRVWTEFWVGRGWSMSQSRTTDANGAVTLPLTYGWDHAGSYSWRVVTTNAHGLTLAAPGRKLTRLTAAPIVTTASTYVTTDVTGSVTAHIDGAGTGQEVWTEFWVGGGWSRSQTRTTDSLGNVTIPLTYGWNSPGVYGWRIVTRRPAGSAGSKPAYIKRVTPSATSVPAVWRSCPATLQGVTVSIGRTEHSRIIVNQTTGSYADVSFHFRDRTRACSFSTVYVERGRIGWPGTREPWARKAGDGSTPLGTYTITEASGQLPSPGTNMQYHQTTTHDYWVWDQSSPYFNTLRDSRLGGFSTARSQRVWDYPYWFTYVLVIDFNRRPVVDRSRGGGIRFHESTGTATGGCVAISRANLRTTVQRIISGDKITIVR